MKEDIARRVTCVAPSNIATIKYWGKRDERLILPLNDSLSVTLSVDLMQAKTTVCASPVFKKNRIWLNGKEETFEGNQRLCNCIEEIQKRARALGDGQSDGIYDWKLHICSENNFPTAAGLASSAAGYACLVFALGQLYNLEGDLTSIARRGSGSACRSLFGGFVRWHMGSLDDGNDSIATQIAPETHWPQLRVLILIVKEEKKKTSSSSGMTRSCATSQLLKARVPNVPASIQQVTEAIKARNFPKFAEITMKDCNQFHAVCLDTYPPAVYMTDVSHSIAALVHEFNDASTDVRLAYTFDAGANACLFFEQHNASLVLAVINHFFPKASQSFRGEKIEDTQVPEDLLSRMTMSIHQPGLIKGLIYSDVGSGPKRLPDEDSLLGADGLPAPIDLSRCITIE